ncbi:calcium-binding protein [Sphingobium amiense]|uniref:Calcium-binding protein n=1 Tax=Sphingobium amiense TaxID=135719 RepID=A0A494W9P4_9SPHN|nr:EF-hand domain-containing protein [Sphingobium amiense]BBD99888.1 calcium-binding protein [Sphingobium amiense]
MLRSFFTTVAAGSLFVGGLAATHLAFAQPGPDGGPRGRGGLMMQADANKDGRISKAEMTAALEARFARMDIDRDGQLTPKDRDLKRQERLGARFAQMDTDGNGQISKAEFTAAHEARAEKRGAGGTQGHKWRGGPRRDPGMAGPAGRDRAVTKADFIARGMTMFDRADANKDGFVTADEMKAAHQAMRAQWQDRKGPPPPPQD